MTRGQIIPFPKLNLSDSSVERSKDVCREMIMDGDPIKARAFLKKFIEKITLTKNACKVAYHLAGVVSMRIVRVQRKVWWSQLPIK